MRWKEFALVALVFLVPAIAPKAQDQNNFEISKNIEIYVDVLRQLNLNYADDIKPGELNTTAITAMLEKLDPYTIYIPESQLEDFELMTKGEYGGIGALIQKQGEYVVITEPYEGFPAQKSGLQAGDKIIAIDGESARGKNSPDVSEKLKGSPGTTIVLSIQHFGDTVVQDVTLEREKVKIPNIPYYGMLDDQVGYLSLTQFNQGAANEVKKAFLELKENKDMKGFILDLRGNGGGLLNEAVDITNLFVPRGTTVVTTRGKLSENVQVHKTRGSAVDSKIPLVVLVDENSASASEIVAGAIQDLDRGVVIGQRTFGKGLVQNVVPLPYNSKIKITVAKYYIPSGRCIQAIDYFDKNANGRPDKVPDSLISSFKTSIGRTVYDGGGIEPDITIEPYDYSQITADLFTQNYLFNYANEYTLRHDSILPPDTYEFTPGMYEDFKNWISNQDFNYKTETEALIENIRGSAEREGYLNALQPLLDSLQQEVVLDKKNDIDRYEEEIARLIKLEIISRYYYQQGKLIATLKSDPGIEKAKEVLENSELLSSILNENFSPTGEISGN